MIATNHKPHKPLNQRCICEETIYKGQICSLQSVMIHSFHSRCHTTRAYRKIQTFMSTSIAVKDLDDLDLKDRIIDVTAWWTAGNNNNRPSELSLQQNPLRPMMDLRSTASFQRQRLHHKDLLVVPFPASLLRERSYELPARHIEFTILADRTELESIGAFLLGASRKQQKSKRKPWRVKHVLIDDDNLWKDASILGLTCTAKQASISFPLPRLWQPDSMVSKLLLPLLTANHERYCTGIVWDLASGAGRDVAFLAEELTAAGMDYTVKGFDHRYNSKESAITSGFWERRGVAAHTRCIKCDVSQWGNLQDDLLQDLPKAIFAVRFWKEDLVKSIARCKNLLPGTLFGLSHFCKPHKAAPWNFDHPSEKSVLERNQLKEIFEDEWVIIEDNIVLDSDHGRTMVQFVARKR